jgi:hypothetical protein
VDLSPDRYSFPFEILTTSQSMYDEQVFSLLHEVGSLRISALQPTVTTSYCHKHRTTVVYISVCSDEGEHVDHSSRGFFYAP